MAIEAGTYAESIIDPLVPVTLVGRCAAQVRVNGVGGNQVALYAYLTQGIVARGLTLTGHVGAVYADSGGVTVEDSVLEGNVAVGVFAKNGSNVTVRRTRISDVTVVAGGELGAGVVCNTGSTAVLEDVAVTGNGHRGLAVGGAGSTLLLRHSYVGRQRRAPVSETAAAVLATDGAELELDGTVVVDNDGNGVDVTGAVAKVSRSVVRRSHGTLAGNDGIGVYAAEQATVTMTDSTVGENPVLNVYADGAGTEVMATDSTFRGSASLMGVEIGRGAQVSGGAALYATRVAVAGVASAGLAFQTGSFGRLSQVAISGVSEIAWPNPTYLYGGFGLLSEDGSHVDATEVTVEAATLSAYEVGQDATLTLDRVLSRDMKQSTASGNGTGTQVSRSATLSANRAFFLTSRSNGVVVASGGVAELTDSTVADTLASDGGGFGNAISLFGKGRLTRPTPGSRTTRRSSGRASCPCRRCEPGRSQWYSKAPRSHWPSEPRCMPSGSRSKDWPVSAGSAWPELIAEAPARKW